jgi:regulator of nonsense transcripts 2
VTAADHEKSQTRPIDLPADSNFAIALINQQQAERAEQQRIKNLVLNYDLTDDQTDGETPNFHFAPSSSNRRSLRLVGSGSLNRGPTRSDSLPHSNRPTCRLALGDLALLR